MLSYNAVSQTAEDAGNEEGNDDKSMVKLTKSERRAKLKKSKKENKKQGKELAKTEEMHPTQQEAALVCFTLFLLISAMLSKKRMNIKSYICISIGFW